MWLPVKLFSDEDDAVVVAIPIQSNLSGSDLSPSTGNSSVIFRRISHFEPGLVGRRAVGQEGVSSNFPEHDP